VVVVGFEPTTFILRSATAEAIPGLAAYPLSHLSPDSNFCKFKFLRSWCLLQGCHYIPIPLGIAGPLNGCRICPYSHGHCGKGKEIAALTKETFDGVVVKAKTISSRRPLRTFSTKDATTTMSIRRTTSSAIASLEEIKEDSHHSEHQTAFLVFVRCHARLASYTGMLL